MKKWVLLLCILCLTFPMYAMGGREGSGELERIVYDFSDFDSINAGYGGKVVVKEGSSYSVRLTIDDNLSRDYYVKMKKNTIYLERNSLVNIINATILLEVTLPELKHLALHGGATGDITMENKQEKMEFYLSGGSRLVGDIKAGTLLLDLSGGSKAELKGAADFLTLESSGGSKADCTAFPAESCTIDGSGSSELFVHVNESLHIELSGGAMVEYIGEPVLETIDTSGSSKIKKGRNRCYTENTEKPEKRFPLSDLAVCGLMKLITMIPVWK